MLRFGVFGDSNSGKKFLLIHYENTPMQYTAIFHCCKNDNFQLIFWTIFICLLKTYIGQVGKELFCVKKINIGCLQRPYYLPLRGENLGLYRCVLTKLNAQYVKIY